MTKRRRLAVMGAVVATSCLTPPPPASACEPAPCQAGYIVPEPGSRRVPENHAALFWRDTRGVIWPSGAGPGTIALQRARAGVPHGVTPDGKRQRVTPATPWKAGERWTVVADNRCFGVDGPKQLQVELAIGPNAKPPTALGQLEKGAVMRGKLQLGTSVGSCNVEEEAVWLDVEVALDPTAAPWSDVLEYQTLVDGKPYRATDDINASAIPGTSWQGRGRDRLYARCEPDSAAFPGVGEGDHEVVFTARIAGGSAVWKTPPLSFSLACDAQSQEGSPALPPSASGPAATQGGKPRVMPPGQEKPVPMPHARGCTCAASSSPPSAPWGQSASLLLLGLVLRRRRFRSHQRLHRGPRLVASQSCCRARVHQPRYDPHP